MGSGRGSQKRIRTAVQSASAQGLSWAGGAGAPRSLGILDTQTPAAPDLLVGGRGRSTLCSALGPRCRGRRSGAARPSCCIGGAPRGRQSLHSLRRRLISATTCSTVHLPEMSRNDQRAVPVLLVAPPDPRVRLRHDGVRRSRGIRSVVTDPTAMSFEGQVVVGLGPLVGELPGFLDLVLQYRCALGRFRPSSFEATCCPAEIL